ncbi:MAG: Rrf2 family transcriptional regulator [bacterium]
MIISTKCQYALRAVFEIARSNHGGVMTIAEIAEAQNVPQRYLEGILNELRKGGILEAQRGRSGGYKLAGDVKNITVGAVVRLIDGPIRAVEESGTGNNEALERSVFFPTWQKVQLAIDEALDSTAFSQLLRLDDDERLKRSPSYVI